MVRKASDLVLLLGSRGSSRKTGRSAFGQVVGRILTWVGGRSTGVRPKAASPWAMVLIALLCFAGGFVAGDHFATPKEPPGKAPLQARAIGELDTKALSNDALIVAVYEGVADEDAKVRARALVDYLKGKGFPNARPREFRNEQGSLWYVVVYCMGPSELAATRRLLKELPADAPDEHLARLRAYRGADGKVWPFDLNVR